MALPTVNGQGAVWKHKNIPTRPTNRNGHRLSSHDWMVGDSWTDMQCATNAGVKGAFCTFGFGRLKEARFTVKINRFDELLMHLKAEE